MFLEYLYCIIYSISLMFCIFKYLDYRRSFQYLVVFTLIYGVVDFLVTGDYVIHMNEYVITNILVVISDFIMISILNKRLNWLLLFYTSLYNILFIFSINMFMYTLGSLEYISILDSFDPSLSRFFLVVVFNGVAIILYKVLEKVVVIPEKLIVHLEYKLYNFINIICYFSLLIFFGYQIQSTHDVYSIVIVICFIILWGLLVYALTKTFRLSFEKEEYIMMDSLFHSIEESVSITKEQNEKINKIKHDIKNHLVVLKNVTNDKKVLNYIHEMDKDFKALDNKGIVNSGNVYLDAILNTKSREYPEVNFEYILEIEGLNMNPKDLSSLIFNLVDNAAKAASSVCGQVFISIIYDNGRLNVDIRNDCKEEPTFIPKDKNHGYGLKIIEGIVQKYSGCIEREYQNQIVNYKILIVL